MHRRVFLTHEPPGGKGPGPLLRSAGDGRVASPRTRPPGDLGSRQVPKAYRTSLLLVWGVWDLGGWLRR